MSEAALRAVFVTGSLAHGGAERHAVAVMNRLAERRHECHAVYVKSDASLRDRLRLHGGGSILCLDAERYFDARALRDFAAHFARVAPSVVVAANPYALMYAGLALRLARLRVPLVATYHSTRLLGMKEWLQMLVYRPFFWTADCAIFVCERQRRHWLRRGAFSRRNEVIYNGVDTDLFRDRGDPDQRSCLRRRLGIRDTDYVIGISALLRPEKNHLQLVEAIARLRGSGLPAKALMIGEGEMRPAIEARARSLGVGGDIVITGLQQDVRPYVEACDVVVLCSFTEAFSLSAIEAMALGRPVVHSDVGGAAEMIHSGHNGFLFAVGDTEGLVDKLATLADGTLATRMGHNARAVVERQFSEKAMVDRYEELLLELCAKHSVAAVHPDHRDCKEFTH